MYNLKEFTKKNWEYTQSFHAGEETGGEGEPGEGNGGVDEKRGEKRMGEEEL